MAERRNEGVINRGTINAGSFAVGRGAVAQQTIHQGKSAENMKAVEEQLQQLLKLLAEQGHNVPDRQDVVRSAEKVQEELKQEKPSKLTVTSLLDGIASAVKSVGTIATVVEGLKAAVIALF